ncbi:MiaB-like tRNA modifying enzyme [Ferroglobus placidus DSM 10642]|uniref:tRNA-t(6)A37 methylthiotransferase n=1 Tax=Ferroglobus placidus (strain DSM 10642 / AEDII12DO) TaxID=589924 RepID=D3RX09_FERPA|nr:tRNA (N(6)-L-threonylcarbamoyladenosine(37)-C(2))-methylthiotransferase [Ferroglobus placidus]ADC65022.1 MiaB-like tRNA modifying enzyme [Ferroglobus placidus DSM 10642]
MKVYIETYGCTMNQADSDIMRGLLSREYAFADSAEEADVVIVNTCGVIGFTERKILRRIEEIKGMGKKVIAAGCLARIARKRLKIADALVSPDNVHRINEAVKAVLNGERVEIINVSRVDKAEISGVKCRLKENAIAIVSISEGCLGNCSYCATKIARGRLRSFSIEKIVEEVKKVVEMGYKEIQLTSQDTGAYGKDKGYRLPDLLEKISEIEGDFRVRVGMMNPQHAMEILDDLIEAFKSEKIYKFLHLPVQSGDNKVLMDMRRGHTVEDFEEVVSAFRKAFDDVLLSTDVIVGFPTESEESFEKTVELIKRVKPDIVNITRFSPREGTLAAKLKDIPDWIKKERSRKLTKICEEIGLENNLKFVGKKLRVLVTKRGKNETLLARADSYRPVVLEEGTIGEFYRAKVVDAKFNYLVGELCS